MTEVTEMSQPQLPINFCRSKNFCRLSVGISSKFIPWLLALCSNITKVINSIHYRHHPKNAHTYRTDLFLTQE